MQSHERAAEERGTRPTLALGPVAVIGAGIAGLACARALHDHGVEVTVFDKGRRVGGRAAHRREGERAFDHGAQYLTAHDPAFRRLTEVWREEGALAFWDYAERDPEGAVTRERRVVGAGSMRRLAEHIARKVDVRLETQVAPFAGRALFDAHGAALGEFARVVVTAPLAQARELLSGHPDLAARLGDAVHEPCWCVMASWDAPLPTTSRGARFDALRGRGLLSWAARDASKPGRAPVESWVLHASPAWSAAHLEDDPGAVVEALLSALADELGAPLAAPSFARAHRWRFARVARAVGVPCLYDAEAGVAVAGDGLLGPRVEAAWQSGVAAAARILGAAGAREP